MKRILGILTTLSLLLSITSMVYAENVSLYETCEGYVLGINEDSSNANVEVLFNEDISPSSVTDETVYVTKSDSTDIITVSPTVKSDNKTVIFSTNVLEAEATYRVIVDGVKCYDNERDVTPNNVYTFTVAALSVIATNVADNTALLTNVLNASKYTQMGSYWDYTNSVYLGEPLKITFSKALDATTVNKNTIKITTGTVQVNYTPVVENNKVMIDLAPLYSNEDYVVTVSSDVKDSKGVSVPEYSFGFSTGLISRAPYVENKAIECVSLASMGASGSVVNTDGTKTFKAQLTDGLLEGTAISYYAWSATAKQYALINLGKEYDIAAVGAFYPNKGCDYHLYCTTVYVGTNELTATDLESSNYDAIIPWTTTRTGDGSRVWNNNINAALSTPKKGQYVALKKTDGGAYLNEVFVFAYKNLFSMTSVNTEKNSGITNVSNASAIDKFKNNEYIGDKLEFTFDKELVASSVTKNSLIITEDSIEKAVNYTPEVSGNVVSVDLSALKPDNSYTVSFTSGILATDGSIINAADYKFSTGLIAAATHQNGKEIKLVSVGKTVTRQDGTYTGVYDATYAVNTNLQTLTDGILGDETKNVKYPQGEYITVDLGAQYNIAAVGAYWPLAPWHLYTTSVYVTEDKPNGDISSLNADGVINYIKCGTPSNPVWKPLYHNVTMSVNAENGRYVSYNKTGDGEALLTELYVFAYVDENAEVDAYFTNDEKSVSFYADGIDSTSQISLIASYENGKLIEVNEKSVAKGEGYNYKGFVWNKEDISYVLDVMSY